MRIGIMTFWFAPNHGALLQAYALQSHLQGLGHEPFFIRYHCLGFPPRKGLLGLIGRTPGNTVDKIRRKLLYIPFGSFQRKYLRFGFKDYQEFGQLWKTPPAADAYICGSDQIWNPIIVQSEDDRRAFWLDFGDDAVRRVSYAASLGVSNLAPEVASQYARYARRMDFISVREKDAVGILEGLGRPVTVWVPDPTLLLDISSYDALAKQVKDQTRLYVFCYHLGPDLSLANRVADIVANKKGLSKYEAKYDLTTASILNLLNMKNFGPAQWLSAIRHSSFVVTNSFHGTIFSLLYRRPFFTVFRTGPLSGMINRITILLEEVGLHHRIVYEHDLSKVVDNCDEEIDWDSVNSRLRALREVGVQFLKTALAGCGGSPAKCFCLGV